MREALDRERGGLVGVWPPMSTFLSFMKNWDQIVDNFVQLLCTLFPPAFMEEALCRGSVERIVFMLMNDDGNG